MTPASATPASATPASAVHVPPADLIPAGFSRALFWRPRFAGGGAMAAHLPLLFWLMETARPSTVLGLGLRSGEGYFALCQAIEHLNLPARAWGFGGWADAWQAETAQVPSATPPQPASPHPASPQPALPSLTPLRPASALPQSLRAHNAQTYPEISRLAAVADPAQALGRFGAGMFDLILIDGAGLEGAGLEGAGVKKAGLEETGPEALAALLGQRASARAVLLLVGTGDPGEDAPTAAPTAARALLAALASGPHGPRAVQQFSDHGGCALVLLGAAPDPRLARLAALSPTAPGFNDLQTVLARLGQGHLNDWHRRQATDALHAALQAADQHRTAQEAESRAALEAQALALRAEAADRAAALTAALAIERAAERDAERDAERAAANEAIAGVTAEAYAATAALTAALAAAVAEREAEREAERVAAQERAIQERARQPTPDLATPDLAALQARLEQGQALRLRETRVLTAELERLTEDLRQQRLDSAQALQAAIRQATDSAQAETAAALAEARAAQATAQADLAALRIRHFDETEDLRAEIGWVTREADSARAALTEALAEARTARDAALAAAAETEDDAAQRIALLVGARDAGLARLTAAHGAALAAEAARATAARAEHADRIAALNGSLAAATRALGKERTARARLERQVQALTAEAARRDRQHQVQLKLRDWHRGWLGAAQSRLGRKTGPSGGPLAAEVAAVARHPLFDAAWYLSAHPDLQDSGLSPAEHFVRHGLFEGRDPGPRFQTLAWLQAHPEALAARRNPLLDPGLALPTDGPSLTAPV